uniref:Zinc finger CCCH-type containing 15 n=1 Tax=Salmo trutta TaxID=8032 RepID=A0A674B4M6_SALTR
AENWKERRPREVLALGVCKYFLCAIENNKYGWFWVCPGGGINCMYLHPLPARFIKKKEENLTGGADRECALGPDFTRITLKRQERIAKDERDMERKTDDFSPGRSLGVMVVFEFHSDLVDDDEEADDTKYAKGRGGLLVSMISSSVDIVGSWPALLCLSLLKINLRSEASGGVEENGSKEVHVDLNLFTGEDLDELEKELNTRDLLNSMYNEE